jgi:FtsZ-binding cell division protein ZapB
MLDGSIGLWLASSYMLLYVLGCERDMESWLFRLREEACGGAGNKACREKMRRDRLNDRFLELSTVLEPGKPPKTDKATILSDAVRILTQLRSEAQQLQDSNNQLRDTIKDLKVEKNELRDEKTRLKADKEKLEQQVKDMTIPTGYLPHPAAIHAAAAAFAAQSQAASSKAAQMAGYPGMAMWQWMPPAAVDTSQDHVLRPPVA